MIFHGTDLSKYELKNDIIINIETDLANANFKDDYVFGNPAIQKNNFDVKYYYKGNEYIPTNYSGTSLADGEAVLSASGEGFRDVSTITTGLTESYYLFALANPPTSVAEMYDFPEEDVNLQESEIEDIEE